MSNYNQHDYNAQNYDQQSRDHFNSGNTWEAAKASWEADAQRAQADRIRHEQEMLAQSTQTHNDYLKSITNLGNSGGYSGGSSSGASDGFFGWLLKGLFITGPSYILFGLIRAALVLAIPAAICFALLVQITTIHENEKKAFFDRSPRLNQAMADALADGTVTPADFAFSDKQADRIVAPKYHKLASSLQAASAEHLAGLIKSELNKKNHDSGLVQTYAILLVAHFKANKPVSANAKKLFTDYGLQNHYVVSRMYEDAPDAAQDYFALAARGLGKIDDALPGKKLATEYRYYDHRWTHFDHAYAIAAANQDKNLPILNKIYEKAKLPPPKVSNGRQYSISDGFCMQGYCLNFDHFAENLGKLLN